VRVSADRAARCGPHTRGKPRLLDVERRIPARDRFAPDSPLEGDGFGTLGPRSRTGESLWLNGNDRCRPRETGGPDNPPPRPRESSYDVFAVVAVRMSALRLSAAIRPLMPWLFRIAANSERRVATSLIAPGG
jgi:hypothetical protein